MRTTPAYLLPEDTNEALELAARNPDSVFLAGGTSRRVRDENRSTTLIDLRKLRLDSITTHADGMRIGATTPLQRVLESDAAHAHGGGILAAALESCGHAVWRHHATLGGRLLDPDADDLVCPVLLVLDARVVSQPAPGAPARSCALNDLERRNAGLVLCIEVPPQPGWQFAMETLRLTAYDPPITGVVVGLRVEGGRSVAARVAACGVGISQRRAPRTESALSGTVCPSPTFESAQSVFQREIEARDDTRASREFRGTAAAVLLGRALRRASESGTQGKSRASAR
jgi:xanthine dehydrogenase small subunit